MATKTRPTFTPGPWEVERRGTGKPAKWGAVYTTVDGLQHFVCGIDGIPIGDARLIAAAPDLYDALAELLEMSAGDPAIFKLDAPSIIRAALAKVDVR